MFGFIGYIWKQYLTSKKLNNIDRKMDEMIEKIRGGDTSINYKREFALLQGKRFKLCGRLRK